jgi:asparagine synthase (glutamine-hydrolysing)
VGTACVGGRPYDLGSGADRSPAEATLAAYGRRGEAVPDGVGGSFAMVVWDRRDDSLLCVRDPLGVHPLFWVRTAAGVMVSPTVEALLQQPEVPRRVNRAALADHLRHSWPHPEETFFEGISRVLPGSWLRLRGSAATTARYWDPLFPGRHPEWVDESDLGRFDELIDASVARLTDGARTAIYLSGGLDSVSVGALAADRVRREGRAVPLALSLVFPDPWSEETVQAGVAARLDLPHMIVRLEKALDGDGIVRAAVQRGAFGAPVQNPWLPAYRWLAGQAVDRGREVILTGSGGDEWLTVTPVYAADLLRTGRLGQLVRLGRAQARSTNVAPGLLTRNLLWRYGARPLVVSARSSAARRFAPELAHRRRLERLRQSLERRSWLAPDPELRRQLLERDEQFAGRPPEDDLLPLSGPREYFRECRMALTHPLTSMEAEEVFEYSRGAGARVVHPYWDTRLVEFLHATPPELLNRGGRSKGLIRHMLAQRFPDLGFEQQRKSVTASFFGASVLDQAPGMWRELGGAQALRDAGVVDGSVARLFEGSRGGAGPGSPAYTVTDPMWEVLVAEGWLRRHV